jgi:hypothetical protein
VLDGIHLGSVEIQLSDVNHVFVTNAIVLIISTFGAFAYYHFHLDASASPVKVK